MLNLLDRNIIFNCSVIYVVYALTIFSSIHSEVYLIVKHYFMTFCESLLFNVMIYFFTECAVLLSDEVKLRLNDF